MAPEVSITFRGVDELSDVAEKIERTLVRMLMRVNDAMTEMTKRTIEASEALEKLEKTGKDAGEKTEKTLVKTSKAAKALSLALVKVSEGLVRMGKMAKAAFEAVGRGVETSLTSLGQRLRRFGATSGGSRSFLSPIIRGLRGTANAAVDAVRGLLSGGITAIQGFISSGAQAIGSALKSISQLVGTGIGTLISGPVGGIGSLLGFGIGSAVGAIPKMFADAFAGAVNAAGSALRGLSEVVTGAVSAAVNVASAILETLVGVVQGVVERMGAAFSALVGKIGGILGNVVGKVTTVFAGMVAVAGFKVLQFEKQLEVAFGLIPDAGEKAFTEMRNRVARLSTETPFLTGANLAEGLFFAISSGAREATEAMRVLEASTLAAVGGNANLGEVVVATTKTSSLFNKTAKETADLLFQTQNLGVLTFGDLAQGIGRTLGIAKAAKVEIKDLLSAIAAGTRVLTPEETFTGIARSIQSLAAPGPESQRAMDRLGISFVERTEEEKALVQAKLDDIDTTKAQIEILVDMERKTHTQTKALRDLRKELAKQKVEFEDVTKASGRFVGLMESIRRITARGFNFPQVESFIPNVRAQKLIVGLAEIGDQVDEVTKGIDNFEGAAQKAFDRVAGTVRGSLSLAWKGFVGLVERVEFAIKDDLVAGYRAAASALRSFASSPAFAEITAWAGDIVRWIGERIGGAFSTLRDNWESVKETLRTGWTVVKTLVMASWNAIKGISRAVRTAAEDGALTKMQEAWESIKETVRETWQIIGEAAQGNLEPLRMAVSGLWETFSSLAELAWARFKQHGLSAIAVLAGKVGEIGTALIAGIVAKAPNFAKKLGLEGITPDLRALGGAADAKAIGKELGEALKAIPEEKREQLLGHLRGSFREGDKTGGSMIARIFDISVSQGERIRAALDRMEEQFSELKKVPGLEGMQHPRLGTAGELAFQAAVLEAAGENLIRAQNPLSDIQARLEDLAETAAESADAMRAEIDARRQAIRAQRGERAGGAPAGTTGPAGTVGPFGPAAEPAPTPKAKPGDFPNVWDVIWKAGERAAKRLGKEIQKLPDRAKAAAEKLRKGIEDGGAALKRKQDDAEREKAIQAEARRKLDAAGLLESAKKVAAIRRSSNRTIQRAEDFDKGGGGGPDRKAFARTFQEVNRRSLMMTQIFERLQDVFNSLRGGRRERFLTLQSEAKDAGFKMTASVVRELLKASKQEDLDKARTEFADAIESYAETRVAHDKAEVERIQALFNAIDKLRAETEEASKAIVAALSASEQASLASAAALRKLAEEAKNSELRIKAQEG